MTNQDIKDKAKNNGVYLWQIADYLKISEYTLTRKLRKPLTKDFEQKIQNAIKELMKKGA